MRQALVSKPLFCQFSSIGSLGKNEDWFVGELGKSLAAQKGVTPQSARDLAKKQLKLVFPTEEDVRWR